MNGRYAILVDGGFLNKKLATRLGRGRRPSADDIERECGRIMAAPALDGLSLLRIFYYHARPCADTIHHPISKQVIDLGRTPEARYYKELFKALELKDNFALRLGETFCVGWKLGAGAARDMYRTPRPLEARDVVPDIRQKGVDMRIGIDISWMSMRRLVDALVIVTGDSDFVPIFKLARREGVRVYLETLGHGVWHDLKAHADLVL